MLSRYNAVVIEEAMQVYGRLQQQGEIESYEPIALELTGEVSS